MLTTIIYDIYYTLYKQLDHNCAHNQPTCNGINGVKSAKDGGAGGAVHEEGETALGLVLQHPLLELLRDHSAPLDD